MFIANTPQVGHSRVNVVFSIFFSSGDTGQGIKIEL